MNILGIIPRLAMQSLANRKTTAILTILSIALSVFLLLGVEKLRSGAKQSFLQTISGTDLVIGPRSSGTQLLLYSVFHIGNPSNNITLKTLNKLAKHAQVKWLVPISLGDSHRGFRVVGTKESYFDHIKTVGDRQLEFISGRRFGEGLQAVIGAKVAEKIGYKIGDEFVVSHGLGEISFSKHQQQKFEIVGILKQTGTPIDGSLFVSLRSIEAMHHEWYAGKKSHGDETDAIVSQPKLATAAFVGLKDKISVLSFQRVVNQFAGEPISAVIPAVAFAEIWRLVSKAQSALLVVAALVALTAITGMVISLFSSLNERRREMAILRSIGAGPMTILWLFISEALFLAGCGIIIGTAAIYLGLWLMAEKVTAFAGIYIPLSAPSLYEALFLCAIVASTLIGAIIPAWRAYRTALNDGLVIRI